MLQSYSLLKFARALKLITVLFFSVYGVENVFASQSPYPKSAVISGITWDPSSLVRKAPGSDNWPLTWAADDNQYTSWGDGGGFGGTNSAGRVSLGVARILGEPENFLGQNVWGGNSTENNATFGGKSYGILSVDGVLYMWRGPGSNFTSWTETRLAISTDLGASWQLSEIFFRDPDGIGLPTFLNFGQDYAGARDGFVYSYSGDPSNGSGGPWINVHLMRVPKGQIATRAAYEFFSGVDSAGNPTWTSDVAQRAPVFSDSVGGVSLASVIYHAGLKRYFLVATHGDANGSFSDTSGGLGIFDTSEPWGPWTTVEYKDNWMGSTNMFFANFSPKWISSDGKTMYLIFTGFGNDVIAKDNYQHIKGVLTLSGTTPDTTPPTIPQSLNATPQSGKQIDLTWEAASDPESGISKYNIYRDGSNVGQSITTSFSDTGLDEGTTYSYQVSAVNGAGLESTKSTPVSATTLADTIPPTITSASISGDPTKVTVVFSEPVEQISAENVSNYVINSSAGSGQVTILTASLGADFKTVTLSTGTHNEGITYTLTVNNIKDRASTPNVIAANTQATYTFVAQLIISNLTVANGQDYVVVQDGLLTGAAVYIDRSFTYSTVPAPVQGATYIKTANNDKSSTGTSFFTFNVNQNVTVYVAHDNRITTKPSWLAGFTDTGEDIVTTDTALSLFAKDFPAGAVALGGNEGSGKSMYTVVILGQGSSSSPPPDTTPPTAPTGLTVIQ